METLKGFVNLGRLSASGGNLQPLKYILSRDEETNAAIFPCLAWAGYLKDWAGPEEGERPTAYIILLGDTKVAQGVGCDHGIAAQSILLGAREAGLAGCMIASINKEKLRGALNIPKEYKIVLVLAIGKPKEKIVLEEVRTDQDIKYYRDKGGIHHVPKRSLNDVIVDAHG